MSVIDEVKQRTDIVDVVGQYVKLTKSGRTFRGLCPFHSEKHPSFFVYPERQSWHCFGACNSGGDAFSFVMKKESIDFGEALRLMAQRTGVSLPSKFESSAKREEEEKLYQANQAAAEYFHNLLLNSPEGEKTRNYVADRGLSLETIISFQLGFSLNSWEALKQYLKERGYTESELLTAGLIIETESKGSHDRFRNRLIFPIADARGRITGFGARALDDSQPKYLNSPQTPIFDKSSILYGINLAATAIRQQNMAVIVEGYMDVITAHQNGFQNVVASMGTSITEEQVKRIKRLTKNIALALDADTAGEEAMLRGIGYENTLDAEVKVIILPQGKDPDDVIKQDSKIWQNLVDKALPIVDYAFNMITAKLDLTTAKDKSFAADELLHIITEIKDTVRQAHYLQKLARLVNVTEHRLESALGRIKPYRRTKEPKPKATTPLRFPLSNPREEYCLTLLLQHPELKDLSQYPSPEYFQNSENREIFIAWQKTNDISSLKDELDPAIWEHFDYLKNKTLPTNGTEERYANCVLLLREDFLRGLVTKTEAALTIERELGGTKAELAKFKEQGLEVSLQLSQIFTQKRTKKQEGQITHKG